MNLPRLHKTAKKIYVCANVTRNTYDGFPIGIIVLATTFTCCWVCIPCLAAVWLCFFPAEYFQLHFVGFLVLQMNTWGFLSPLPPYLPSTTRSTSPSENNSI